MCEDSCRDNFPSISKIFGEKMKSKDEKTVEYCIKNSKKFDVTLEDVCKNAFRRNPFEKEPRSSDVVSSSRYVESSPMKTHKNVDPFHLKRNDLYEFIMHETKRFINEDHRQYLCAHSKRELDDVACFGTSYSLRKKMLRVGLL